MIANCSLKHRVFFLERVENRTDRRRTIELELHFVADARESAKMVWKNDTNHRESFKHQVPSSREAPNIKFQAEVARRRCFFWSLVIGISLELGAWNLELIS